MKPVVVVLFLVLGLGLLGAAMWLGNQASPPVDATKTTAARPVTPPATKTPKIAATGPYPKAVAPAAEFDFGTMMHEAESSHTYTIRNEGEAPLELIVGTTTCNCTGAVLGTEDPVPPGGETTVTVSWKVKNPNPSFRHSATINTNDPKNQAIELVIKGNVEQGLQYDPPGVNWDLGDAGDQTVIESQKAVYSNAVESFRIVELASNGPQIKCTSEPMDAAALAQYNAKCGYLLHLTADVADISGNLMGHVRLKTDLPNDTGNDLLVKVRKQGPIELIARNWNAEHGRLSLGEFKAAEGKQIEVNVFTRVPEEVNLISAESEHNAVTFRWEKDESYKSKSKNMRRYRLKVQVPPGLTAVQRQQGSAEKVDLKFDHPKIGTLKIVVDYLSI